jgi:hypothetical protein
MSSLDLHENETKSVSTLKFWVLGVVLCLGIFLFFYPLPLQWNEPLSVWGAYASILGTGVSIWVLKNAQTIRDEIQDALKKYGLYYTTPDMRVRLDKLIEFCGNEDVTVSKIKSEVRTLLAPLNHLADAISSEELRNATDKLAETAREAVIESKKSKNALASALNVIHTILSGGKNG